MTSSPASGRLPVAVLLTLAMLAFAGNSLLTRAALADAANDPLAFAAVRVISGAAALGAFLIARRSKPRLQPGHLVTALALLGYLLGFSLAYRSMTAASGAFILFSTVQLSMIAIGLLRGDRFRPRQWLGVAIALIGLGWLLMPGMSAPPLTAALLMIGAGLSWGIYSIVGSDDRAAVARTAVNFAGAAIIMAALLPFIGLGLTGAGWIFALVSGIVTSALGYVIWYAVLPHLSRVGAATAQLSVPVIAAVGGTLLLGETADVRLLACGALIVTGVALTLRR